MALNYDDMQHRAYLTLTDRVAARWLDVFGGNTAFYSAVYWDLLTGMWRRSEPVRKTEALGFMTGVRSPHTAGKHIRTAMEEGLIAEHGNPRDARSKLLVLSTETRRRLDVFFDGAVDELRRTAREIDSGPVPGTAGSRPAAPAQ